MSAEVMLSLDKQSHHELCHLTQLLKIATWRLRIGPAQSRKIDIEFDPLTLITKTLQLTLMRKLKSDSQFTNARMTN